MCQELVKRHGHQDPQVLKADERTTVPLDAHRGRMQAWRQKNRVFLAGSLSLLVSMVLLIDLWFFDGASAGSLVSPTTCSTDFHSEERSEVLGATSQLQLVFEAAACLAVFGAAAAVKGARSVTAAGRSRQRSFVAPNDDSPSFKAAAHDASCPLAPAAVVFKDFDISGRRGTPHQYCSAARSLARMGDLAAAERMYQQMQALNITPSSSVFTAMIDACVKAQLPDKCEKYLTEMIDCGLQPCLFSFSSVIHAWARRGDVASAEAWLKRMTASGVEPDAVVCNSFIHAYSTNGDIAGAGHWLSQQHELGLETTVASYTSVIDACAKAGNVQQAELWFQRLEADGKVPNVITFSTMIDACAKAGALDAAERWHERMLCAGIQPNAHSYGAMVNACAKSTSPRAAEAAEYWLERAERAGVVRDVVIYSSGVDACAKAGDAERALRIFRRGQENGYSPNIMAFCALARAFAHRGDWIKVDNIAREMDTIGVRRNEFFVYAQMMGYALAKPRQRDRAEQCLREIIHEGIAVNDHIAAALSRAVGKRRALELMEELCAGRALPVPPARRPERTAQRSAVAKMVPHRCGRSFS